MRHLLNLLLQPWAIRQDYLITMREIVNRRMEGIKADEDLLNQVRMQRSRNGDPKYTVKDRVAYVPIDGVISKRMSFIDDMSGGATTHSQIREDFDKALNDKEVDHIVFMVDSPGGHVFGDAELSEYIHSKRGQKPMTAYVDGMMASAAYWIASAADRIVASQASEVGSIGVYAVLQDLSVMAHQQGVKVDVIRSGPDKGTLVPGTVITENQKKVIQDEIDTYFGLFKADVTRNRGLSGDRLEEVSTGKTFIGQKALEVGLVDEIASLDAVVKANGSGRPTRQADQTTTKQASTNAEQTEESTMEPKVIEALKALSAEQLAEHNPDLIKSIEAAGEDRAKKALEADQEKVAAEAVENGKQEAAKAERERCEGVVSLLQTKEYSGYSEIAIAAVKDGSGREATESKMKDQRIADLQKGQPANPGADADPAAADQSASDSFEGMEPKERAEAEWDKNHDNVRKEFSKKETYVAYRVQDLRGNTKVFKTAAK